MPEELRDVSHAWYRKGAIDLYLSGVDFDAMIWIDADCIILSDVVSELTAFARDQDAVVVATAVFDTIAAVIAENRQSGRETISIFEDMVKDCGLSLDLPYLSVGVFLCRSRALLAEWRERTLRVTAHPLFEQNVFNLIVHSQGIGRLVDCRTFNINGIDLNGVSRRDDGGIVNADGQPIRVAHLSSSVDGVLDIIDLHINVGDKVLIGVLRRPTNAVLRAVEHTYIEGLASEVPYLDACGLLEANG